MQTPTNTSKPTAKPVYSVVVPLMNEQEVLPELYARLTTAMEGMGETHELVFIDDGSTDATLGILRSLVESDARVRVVSFSRNFGHQAAVTAGLRASRGSAVIVIDGDLQDPPEVIPQLAKAWRQGYKVVYAIRRGRKEAWIKRSAYDIFYRLLRTIADVEIPRDAGDFALMDRMVVDLLNAMPERNRFVRGIRAWVGFPQIGVEYERAAREAGSSKYSLRRLVVLALDGLVAYSFAPLRLVANGGFIVSAFAFLVIVHLVISKLFWGVEVPGWTSTVAVILFLGGIQLVALGVIGEYVGRIFDEVKRRPTYIVSEELGSPIAEGLRLVEAAETEARKRI